MKYEYEFVMQSKDTSYIPKITLYIYGLHDNIECTIHTVHYLLTFYKINDDYKCTNPSISIDVKNWLVENKIIKINKNTSNVILSPKSLLEIL
jgi:hypothetical protein